MSARGPGFIYLFIQEKIGLYYLDILVIWEIQAEINYNYYFYLKKIKKNKKRFGFFPQKEYVRLFVVIQQTQSVSVAPPLCSVYTLGLIYQSNVETSADPCTQINLRQRSRVIYETFVCRQSHRTKDRTLINVAAENNSHLNITPLKTPRFRSLAPKVYDKEKHNPTKKRK